jgi:hypothetical protein
MLLTLLTSHQKLVSNIRVYNARALFVDIYKDGIELLLTLIQIFLGNAFTIRVGENRYDVALESAELAQKWRQRMFVEFAFIDTFTFDCNRILIQSFVIKWNLIFE